MFHDSCKVDPYREQRGSPVGSLLVALIVPHGGHFRVPDPPSPQLQAIRVTRGQPTAVTWNPDDRHFATKSIRSHADCGFGRFSRILPVAISGLGRRSSLAFTVAVPDTGACTISIAASGANTTSFASTVARHFPPWFISTASALGRPRWAPLPAATPWRRCLDLPPEW